MRLAPIFALLAACTQAPPTPDSPPSACREQQFDGSNFTVCAERRGRVEIRNGSRSFADLEARLGARDAEPAFAMNGGMFDDSGRPIGLAIEAGREVHAINRRKGGGNFHLMPNGVFLVRSNGRAEIVTTNRFAPAADIAFATQSGPMLVIDGELHPRFDKDGTSRYVRNGIGIAPDGTPLFVISEDAVSLGKFARFFRNGLRARNALYFDGSVSSLWDPAAGRRDSFTELGPIVLVFRAAGSAPDREARATP